MEKNIYSRYLQPLTVTARPNGSSTTGPGAPGTSPELPAPRRDVSSPLYASDLRCCALFVEECGLRAANTNEDAVLFMQQLALTVTCEHLLRNVTVVKEGHLASEFFVIHNGEHKCFYPPPLPLESDMPTGKRFSATGMAGKFIHWRLQRQ
ncbi:hypothetical protein V7S43_019016 [Phytophthora oleae]|uniref:Cyclic nucleotide-binding domain-containing protein n=1 Tax=Phytophthora oleae TaxID=2107226 RepID=A0ABD3ESV8_9STRA